VKQIPLPLVDLGNFAGNQSLSLSLSPSRCALAALTRFFGMSSSPFAGGPFILNAPLLDVVAASTKQQKQH